MRLRSKLLPVCFLMLLLLTQSVESVTAAPVMDTSTPIKHIIVVMQQNHTFDNFFGTYPGANGFPANTCLLVSLTDSDKTAAPCISPFPIGDYPISDLSHSFSTFEGEYQNGAMNGFVSVLNGLHQDGTLAMAYYDDRDIPYYWNLADRYVLFDNYFSAAHTGSINNRMLSVAGQGANLQNRIPPNGFGDIPTIFDRLQERGISWKYYIKNYKPDLNYRSLKDLDYLPPQVQWVPLLGFDRFIDNPDLSSRIVDLDEYYTDLQNGTLPAVSYVLLLGASDHPISDLELGQRTIRTMIQMLMESGSWDSTAFFITYDDWGGWYDHVPPPQLDEYGDGFRVPALLVSAYARQGFIDHTQLDHSSILKFIESNWDIPPLASRDANSNNFTSAFDFSRPPRAPIFIPLTREPPGARVEPRRIVIYSAYGAAMIFAAFIFMRANLTKKTPPKFPNPASAQEQGQI